MPARAQPAKNNGSQQQQQQQQVSGDALDDDFALDEQYAPSPSDNEDGDDDDDDERQGNGKAPVAIDPLEEDDFAAASDDDQHDSQRARKRVKRDDTKNQSSERRAASTASTATATATAAAKKDKRKQKKEQKRAKLRELGVGEAENLGLMPPEILADRLADKQRKALTKMSSMELSDLRIPQSFLLDTSSITNRDNLEKFIREALPTMPSTLAKVPKIEGAPRIVVVAGAALRVADLCREVKPFKTKEIDVGKLFAKHFKLAEHAEYLAKTKVGIAVGTPNRIGKLLSETESLKLLHLSHIIIDSTHLDTKQRSFLDMPEARDLFELVLGDKAVMERLRQDKLKLVLF
ncbi:hypothetical protein ACM66B_004958 [Microbotryomycetes sp. NB124-2]